MLTRRTSDVCLCLRLILELRLPFRSSIALQLGRRRVSVVCVMGRHNNGSRRRAKQGCGTSSSPSSANVRSQFMTGNHDCAAGALTIDG